MHVNYNQAFSFSGKGISSILELAESGIYSLNGLAIHSVKASDGELAAVKNTISLLVDIGYITINKGKCQIIEQRPVAQLKKILLEKLKQENILEQVAQVIREGEGGWIKPSSLFNGLNGVLPVCSYLDLVKYDSKKQRYYLTENGIKTFKNNFGKTIEQLKKEQKSQEERGEKAEEYILELELKRLKEHPKFEKIKRISMENVSAGFDIQSFKSLESTYIDKLIEVKSFLGRQQRIYWSINEIKVASRKKEDYILCIVDSSKINDKDYIYKEIPNPYKHFEMSNYTEKTTKKYFEIEPQNFLILLKSYD